MNYLIIIMAASLLLIVYVLQALVSLKWKRQEIFEQWKIICYLWQERLDRLPFLLETIVGDLPSEKKLLTEMIGVRAAAMESRQTPNRTFQKESQLEHILDQLLGICHNQEKIASNIRFLVVRRELSHLQQHMNQAVQTYNKAAGLFNRLRNLFFFSRFFGIEGVRKMSNF